MAKGREEGHRDYVFGRLFIFKMLIFSALLYSLSLKVEEGSAVWGLAPKEGDHLAPKEGDHQAHKEGDHLAHKEGDHLAPKQGDHLAPKE